MSLMQLVEQRRRAGGKPVSVAVVGAGRFASLFLAQIRNSSAVHAAALIDPDLERAHTALALASWPPAKAVARSMSEALDSGGAWVGDDFDALLCGPPPEVVVIACEHAAAAVDYAVAALKHGLSVIMACTDADALAGPALAALAARHGAVYSLAYGTPPALMAELCDWAQVCGFEIAAAGLGASWMPGHESLTPDTIWERLRITPDQAKAQGLDAKRSTARLDGTRTALMSASAANACRLDPPECGLTAPPCGIHDLPLVFRPRDWGGVLPGAGVVEAASALERDGRKVRNALSDGVFVTFSTPANHSAMAFADYNLITDPDGNFAARCRPHRWSGMEAAISVLNVVLRRESTGRPQAFLADATAVAKRDLAVGDILDGIGGACVCGRLTAARDSQAARLLPAALSGGAVMRRPVKAGRAVTLTDVDLPDGLERILALRLETVF